MIKSDDPANDHSVQILRKGLKKRRRRRRKKNRSEIVRIALMLVLRFHRFTICNKICIPERGRAVALETSLPLSFSLSLSLSLTTHNYNKLTTAEIRCNSMSFPRCHRRVSFTDYQIHTGIRIVKRSILVRVTCQFFVSFRRVHPLFSYRSPDQPR